MNNKRNIFSTPLLLCGSFFVLLISPALNGNAIYDLDYFGTNGHRSKVETMSGGEWWKQKPHKRRNSDFILQRPRDKVLAFALYTHDHGVLKITAQSFPLMPNEPQTVMLEFHKNGQWVKASEAPIQYPGWSAHFRIEAWDNTKDIPYRLKLGKLSSYEGLIRKDPIDKDVIVMGSLSCNSPNDDSFDKRQNIVDNLKIIDPDVLFFAGDQNYTHEEHTYGWLQWGVQFAQITKDRPTITIPDDHDIGQGNFWGANGKVANRKAGDDGGYFYVPRFVNMVQRCQTWHLPDPYDPTPVEQAITVYYTNLNVGGVDFAIIEDRKFKTGPLGTIPKMGPRPDHINDPVYDRKSVDVSGLKLLGDRQIYFLHQWGQDWTNATIKAVLSQTAFTGAVHMHGKYKNRLLADLDSNAWPQTGRNKALTEIRRALATHLCGDQHLATTVKHGIENWRDGPYAFTNPAIINTIYGRWWWPEDERRGAGKRIDNTLPWTGDYEDGLGNKMTMIAYSNPPFVENFKVDNPKDRADGFGVVHFNKKTGDIKFDCWPRFSDVTAGNSVQYKGWPITFNMADNDGRKHVGYLPLVKTTYENPVIQVINQATNEILYTRRIRGNKFRPPVYASGKYTVKIGKNKPNLRLFKDQVITLEK